MAVLGKRKAPEPTVSTEDAQEIFRRHFEAQFLPLPEAKRKAKAVEEEDGSEDDSDSDSGSEGGEWDGLSNEDEDDDEGEDESEDDEDDDEEEEEDDDSPVIEVVDHSASQAPTTSTMSKRELKAFMSSRPPDQSSSAKPAAQPSSSKSSSAALPEDAPSLLAQDLELRRLIAESHLLQTNKPLSLAAALSTTSSPNAQPKAFSSGRVRQKALDMRIQALGSKTSILKQEKMPMHMRKGINAAAVEREAKRRREAKETGVILERETGKKKRRDRKSGGGGGGFGPAVGRLKGAELRISERDVKKIEGTRDTFGRRGGKR
ncbi:hypothetical protein N5P37_001522 [Trichoderma harzianum]|uniref:Protein FAF1 n=1 Tax=Trichoderma harzianum CBS 226.95 TaxID=983964 RepID=A0A2T4AQX6_TRIHA|nr:hypothetical protein M431DRAFT_75190 [Trichoderma harzianum CBS 226.95]KAK0765585.1 hypothetical protein N5P37_001522 [Trichoderma harzianum]PTB59464.1 hypothetical protein M431DRAFT_75190 [Trichoderma harzianum CBS 226.95]